MSKFLLYLTILIWPFGLLLTYKNPTFQFPVYYLDIAVSLLFLSTLLEYKKYLNLTKTNLFKAQILFASVLFVSLLANFGAILEFKKFTSFLYLLRVFIYPSIFLVAQRVKVEELKRIILVSVCIFLSLGMIQYLFLPDLRFLKNLGFDDHYYRLVGTMFDPNFTGALISAISLYLFFSGKKLWSLILLIPLSLTFSRASYLSFIVPLITGLFLSKSKNLKPLLLIPILALLVYLIPKPFGEGVNLFRTFSIYSRFQSWSDGLNLFWFRPWFGWGYNTLASNARFSSIDNSFILLLATSGIAGLLSFLNLLRESFISIKLPSRIFILSLLVHCLFNNTFFFIWVLSAFWVILALDAKE